MSLSHKCKNFLQILRVIVFFVIILQIPYSEAYPRTKEVSSSILNSITGVAKFAVNFDTNCTLDDGDSFPDDVFTEEQRLQGALLLHFIGGLYSFTLLAVICNDYFIPAVECICEDLNISQDVAAATFMAVATSSPELAINLISTFIAGSDLGIGTIVGSSMFNALGVAAIGGLAASKPIPIKKWPLVRDSIIYSLTVAVLVSMTWDNVIEWYESTILVSLYFLYFVFMFNNKKIINFVGGLFVNKAKKRAFDFDRKTRASDEEIEDRYTARVSIILRRSTRSIKGNKLNGETGSETDSTKGPKIRKSLWRYPKEKNLIKRLWFLYTWPLKLVLTGCIPSPKTWRRLYPLSFIMCIVCIGANSYFVTWMITIIGETLDVPSSIMGMTFLAFGGCLPEACSIFIMSRRGEGGMGVSNSLGANTLNILFSLGTPWFIMNMVLLNDGDDGSIAVGSTGMDFIILSLILAAGALLSVMAIGKFEMKKTVGATILVIYFVFIIFAILIESGVFFDNSVC